MTNLVDANSVHNRLLNAVKFFDDLILFSAPSRLFMNVGLFECDMVIISMCYACFLTKQHTLFN